MINRRIVRIKAFQVLYSRVSTDNFAILPAQEDLKTSVEKTMELTAMMLLLPHTLTRFANEKLEAIGKMFHPSEQERIKHLKFRDNFVSEFVLNDKSFIEFCSKKGINWNNFNDQLRKLYNNIISSEGFEEYIKIENPTQNDTINLFRYIYSNLIEDFTLLEDGLEDASIWWADDLCYVVNFINDNLSTYIKNGAIPIENLTIENKGVENNLYFAKQLTSTVLSNYDEYVELVQEQSKNWDQARMVFSDILLIVMGIAEAIKFSDIALRVTINEYIEIAKHFSTPKSTFFVNGILNNILRKLQDENRFVKTPKASIGALRD